MSFYSDVQLTIGYISSFDFSGFFSCLVFTLKFHFYSLQAANLSTDGKTQILNAKFQGVFELRNWINNRLPHLKKACKRSFARPSILIPFLGMWFITCLKLFRHMKACNIEYPILISYKHFIVSFYVDVYLRRIFVSMNVCNFI